MSHVDQGFCTKKKQKKIENGKKTAGQEIALPLDYVRTYHTTTENIDKPTEDNPIKCGRSNERYCKYQPIKRELRKMLTHQRRQKQTWTNQTRAQYYPSKSLANFLAPPLRHYDGRVTVHLLYGVQNLNSAQRG